MCHQRVFREAFCRLVALSVLLLTRIRRPARWSSLFCSCFLEKQQEASHHNFECFTDPTLASPFWTLVFNQQYFTVIMAASITLSWPESNLVDPDNIALLSGEEICSDVTEWALLSDHLSEELCIRRSVNGVDLGTLHPGWSVSPSFPGSPPGDE
jgi:hypothetical protein